MNVLVINCGSSSLKFQLINSESEAVLAKGLCERIGIDGRLTYQPAGGEKNVSEKAMPTHTEAIQFVIDALTDADTGVVKSLDEIGAVGHRVVHGGEKFAKSVVVTPEVKAAIAECNDLAPLHNPANLIGIEACESLMPGTPQVVVFDTAFHQTMPEKAYMYGIPYEYYEKYKVRKYGFHGTSHQYVSQRVAELMQKDIKELKIINCHLGQGASVCAIQDGKSVETSMGLTPLGGIVMGTRSGDLDPSVVTYIMQKEGLSYKEAEEILNKESGAYGVSMVSVDFRDIEVDAESGGHHAKLALDIFHDTVPSNIAKCMVAMNGVDVITFTAGVGEKGPLSRKAICEKLEFFGVKIDEEKNKTRGEEAEISSKDSKIKVYTIPTNEELMIARETMRHLRDRS